MKSVSVWLTPVALQSIIRRLPSAVCHIIAILIKNWINFWHHCSVCVSCHHDGLIHIFNIRQLCFSGLYLSLCKWSMQSLKESCLKHLQIQVLLPPPMQWMFTANLAQNYFHLRPAKKSCLQKLAALLKKESVAELLGGVEPHRRVLAAKEKHHQQT